MEIGEILRKHNFRFNRALGQNFIFDGNLLNAICSDAEVTEEDAVLEIGTGAGALTRILSERAKRVVTFEVDGALKPIISEVLAGRDNVEVVFSDILKMRDEEIENYVGQNFKVVANIPYYVTTPIIMRFLESDLKFTSLTLMTQKEVAERLTAKCGTAEYGAITVSVQSRGDVKIERIVDKRNFYPVPKVDSAVVRFDKNPDKCPLAEDKIFQKAVKAAFLWRRKTLKNNLKSMFALTTDKCDEVLAKAGISPLSRGETLDLDGFVKLTLALKSF